MSCDITWRRIWKERERKIFPYLLTLLLLTRIKTQLRFTNDGRKNRKGLQNIRFIDWRRVANEWIFRKKLANASFFKWFMLQIICSISYAAYLMLQILCYVSYLTWKTIFAVICHMIMSISWADRASSQNKNKIFHPKNKVCTVHGFSQGRPNTENLVFAVWLFGLLYRRHVMISLKSFSPEIKIGTHKKAILAEFKFINGSFSK